MKITKQYKLKSPKSQNFIIVDDIGIGNTIDIGHLSREEAEEYSILIQEEFMKNWEKRKKNLENP